MHAMVLIRIKRSGLEDEKLLHDVASLPEVESLYAITGGADCVATIKAKNRDDLVRILKVIQTNPSVLRTTSYLILVTYKEAYQFNPLSQLIQK